MKKNLKLPNRDQFVLTKTKLTKFMDQNIELILTQVNDSYDLVIDIVKPHVTFSTGILVALITLKSLVESSVLIFFIFYSVASLIVLTIFQIFKFRRKHSVLSDYFYLTKQPEIEKLVGNLNNIHKLELRTLKGELAKLKNDVQSLKATPT